MVKAGRGRRFRRLHVHAVLMGSFLLLLLAQSVMMATGRCALHKQVGIAAFVLVPALVVVGMILAPTIYHQVWDGAHFGPPPVRAALTPVVPRLENILLLQIACGVLFGVFMALALWARTTNSGFHKRMIFLGTAVPLRASIDRMGWLPSTFPASPMSSDRYILLAVGPLFLWDVIRNRRVHEAYLVWAAIYLPRRCHVPAVGYALVACDGAAHHACVNVVFGTRHRPLRELDCYPTSCEFPRSSRSNAGCLTAALGRKQTSVLHVRTENSARWTACTAT